RDANSRSLLSTIGDFPRLRDDHGSDDMVAKTTPKTTMAPAEAISKTAFPSPSAISNATVFVSASAGRLKRSDIDFLPRSVDSRRRCCDSVGKFLVALLLVRGLLLGAKHLFIAAKLLEVCDRAGMGQPRAPRALARLAEG